MTSSLFLNPLTVFLTQLLESIDVLWPIAPEQFHQYSNQIVLRKYEKILVVIITLWSLPAFFEDTLSLDDFIRSAIEDETDFKYQAENLSLRQYYADNILDTYDIEAGLISSLDYSENVWYYENYLGEREEDKTSGKSAGTSIYVSKQSRFGTDARLSMGYEASESDDWEISDQLRLSVTQDLDPYKQYQLFKLREQQSETALNNVQREHNASYLSKLNSLVDVYMNTVSSKLLLELAEKNHKRSQEILEKIESNELASETNLLEAQLAFSQTEIAREKQKIDFDYYRANFCAEISDVEACDAVQLMTFEELTTLYSQWMAQFDQPFIRKVIVDNYHSSSLAYVNSAKEGILLQDSDLSFTAQTSMAFESMELKSKSWSVGVSYSYNLDRRYEENRKLRNKLNLEEALQSQAELSVQEGLLDTEFELFARRQVEVDALKKQIVLREKLLNANETRVKDGALSPTQYTEKVLDHFNAQRELVFAILDNLSSAHVFYEQAGKVPNQYSDFIL